MKELPKIIAIVGPTSSGKSDVAVLLAKKYNGEVVSADSRQVYKAMDIGTGKVTKKEMGGILHHMLDIANPKRTYSVSRYKCEATIAINNILKRGKVPIICGGTGFYIQSIVDNIVLPEVKPNPKLRKVLESKTVPELFTMLKKLDAERASVIDKHNPHRLIRAIEIATELGSVPNLWVRPPSEYSVLQIGIKVDEDILKERISTRLTKRLRQGMLAEGKRLHENGLSWKRMEELGLEYRFMAQHLTNKISKEEMIEKINIESWKYAKRQMTWFKRDARIKWVHLEEINKTYPFVENFLDD